MARTHLQYPREQIFPGMTSRHSSASSISSSRPKKRKARLASRLSGTEARWEPNNTGTFTSPLDTDVSQGSSPFPRFSENPQPPDYGEAGSAQPNTATVSMTAHEPPWNMDSAQSFSTSALTDSPDALDYLAQKSKSIKPKVHIKPMLRKMSREEAHSASIDLSRSSTEQEGLGIYMDLERERRRSESLTGMAYRRTASDLHHRSTSGASQLSTATGSSGSKRGSQYVFPMRPTPRAHTPSLSQSFQTLAHGSDEQESDSPEVESEAPPGSNIEQSAGVAAESGPRLPLQIEDDHLGHRLGLSQPNITSRPSFGYSRDSPSALESASPASRSSLDFVFRPRTRTSTDPIARAATVQAARRAFEEKEAAKTRRFEKQQIKAEEKQTRRQSKHGQTKGDPSSAAHPSNVVLEKTETPEQSKQPGNHDRQPSASWKSQSKSTWMLFMTWLRTRVFKIRRKLRKLN